MSTQYPGEPITGGTASRVTVWVGEKREWRDHYVEVDEAHGVVRIYDDRESARR